MYETNQVQYLKMDVRIDPTWKNALRAEFEKDYFVNLTKWVRKAYQTEIVYPPAAQIFRAFDCCPFDKVKVVILGQDPYHGPHQAEGLSFSVPVGQQVPPSLRNMLKEIESDLGHPSLIKGGNLIPWVEQGVLLLNSTLTVSAGKPASHQGIGWEVFTDAAIQTLAKQQKGIVFMLWGTYARQKKCFIDSETHLILEAPHPSPLSASRGFFGCKHFSKANNYLTSIGKTPIMW